MSEPSRPSLFVETDTVYGRVQGIQSTGIKQFKGVPYGAPTSGRNRFMPPARPAAWSGVRECFSHGQVCPQTLTDLRFDFGVMIHWDYQPGGMGEDCLVLNVWTPGLKDGNRRPVLVSFHGGGFASGSGNSIGFDGAQLARFGDVVVVTVNHRLSSFGYLHLADLGAPPEFAHAGVAGIMDLAAALQWVRENIENFGGDPGNVMIFGQSGGGAKTSALLAAPKAKGLFHRAAVQSGSLLRLTPRERATAHADQMLKQLQIPISRIGELQQVPWQKMVEAQTIVFGANPFGMPPVLDGDYFPHEPFEPGAPAESADVPMIISSTLEDAGLVLTQFALTESGLQQFLQERFKEVAAPMLSLYRKHYPDKSPYLMMAMMLTDGGFRRAALQQAERKAAQATAPVYMYQWDWPSPAFGGRYGATHGLDVGATFREAREGNERARLAHELSCAWVAFARTGNPNTSVLPAWPVYDTRTRATMVFDAPTRLQNDPRSELRQFWEKMPQWTTVVG
jgi:para-nitrobenzyl esterase